MKGSGIRNLPCTLDVVNGRSRFRTCKNLRTLEKECEPCVVALLDPCWLEWHLATHTVNEARPKDAHCDEIGLCAHNINNALGAIVYKWEGRGGGAM